MTSNKSPSSGLKVQTLQQQLQPCMGTTVFVPRYPVTNHITIIIRPIIIYKYVHGGIMFNSSPATFVSCAFRSPPVSIRPPPPQSIRDPHKITLLGTLVRPTPGWDCLVKPPTHGGRLALKTSPSLLPWGSHWNQSHYTVYTWSDDLDITTLWASFLHGFKV